MPGLGEGREFRQPYLQLVLHLDFPTTEAKTDFFSSGVGEWESYLPDRSATIPHGLKLGVRSQSRGSDGALSTEGRGQVRPTPEEPVRGP